MEKIMRKLTTIALISAITFAGPVLAQTAAQDQDRQDIQSDKNAIHKDNRALGKDQSELNNDRAVKATDKANGNYGKQAEDSAAIGADKTKIQEKQAEKSGDKKILKHHKKKLRKQKQSDSNQ
jgi:hypothetical protein